MSAVDYASADLYDEDGNRERASWAPVDWTPYLNGTRPQTEPTMLPRADGVCLIYPGLVHSFHGESESGKSLVVQIESVRLIMAGRPVLYVDFESDPASIWERLITLGASPDAIRDRFTYLQPEEGLHIGTSSAEAWEAVLSTRYDLAVIDGVTDSLGLFGYATKDNDDIARWQRVLPKTIAKRTGAGVALIDHVTKDSESRGRFAIGGQQKLSGVTGAAYTVEVKAPLGLGMRGVIVLRVGKDRPARIRAHAGEYRKGDRTQEVARVVVDSTGAATVATVEPWDDNASGEFRPTTLMEHISRALEGWTKPDPPSFNTLCDLVKGSEKNIKAAARVLESGGFITIADGPRNATLHALVKPYRQADDPQSDRYVAATVTASDDCRLSRVPTPGDARQTVLSPSDSRATVSDRRQSRDPEPKSGTCETCDSRMLIVFEGQRTHPGECERDNREATA